MTTKEKLIRLLEDNEGDFLSGNVIADKLGITRAAVWKQIRQLENDGYRIEGIRNKGYRLAPLYDVISAESVSGFLKETKGVVKLEVHDSVGSTNTMLKEKAAELPDWYVIVAGNQTAGRGRAGRSFFSPEGTGIYLSLLLRPDIPVTDAGKLTTAAAVAACRAIEECTDAKPLIKWVNDVFVDGKKVSGILTEASVNFETGEADWIVTGIGLNVYEPEGGFPKELSEIAGSIVKEKQKNLRSRLAASFIEHFYRISKDLSGNTLLKEYKERCFLIGKEIDVLRGEEMIPATALDLTGNYGLLVSYKDGRTEVLSAGEVRVRPVR